MGSPLGRLALLVLLAPACTRPAPPAAHAPPASVQNGTTEAALTTVTLTVEAEQRLGIETAQAIIESVPELETVGGEVIALPGRSVLVTAPVAGTIEVAATMPTAGSRVRKDQAIFDLAPLHAADRDLRFDAEREAGEAEARLTEASQRLARLEQLLAQGSASERAVEEARADQAARHAAAEAARARLSALARSPLGNRGQIVLRAPFEGVIAALRAAPGQTVAASTPLFEVVDVAVVWIRVPLYVGDLNAIDPSSPAEVATLGQEPAGRWRQAARVAGLPSASPGAASADLYFELVNDDRSLRPGERVAVRVRRRGAEQVLVVPSSAVVYDIAGGTWVYEAPGAQRFVRRRVELRGEVGGKVVVTRGLEPGTAVVTTGVAELYGTEFGPGK